MNIIDKPFTQVTTALLKFMNNIIILKLDRPECAGDWHDKPLRYAVNGPGRECQKFSTKRDAQKYASIRRRSTDFITASNLWISLP